MEFPPLSREMTPVLMERQLLLVSNNERRPITVRIGIPVQDVETVGGLNWRCPVEFVGLSTRPFPAVGVDAVQAVAHALFAARVEADAYEREKGGHFLWLDEPGHGLPAVDLGTPSRGLTSA